MPCPRNLFPVYSLERDLRACAWHSYVPGPEGFLTGVLAQLQNLVAQFLWLGGSTQACTVTSPAELGILYLLPPI